MNIKSLLYKIIIQINIRISTFFAFINIFLNDIQRFVTCQQEVKVGHHILMTSFQVFQFMLTYWTFLILELPGFQAIQMELMPTISNVIGIGLITQNAIVRNFRKG